MRLARSLRLAFSAAMAGEPIWRLGDDTGDLAAALHEAGFGIADDAASCAAAVLVESERPLLAKLRREHGAVPLLILSSRTAVEDRVRALDAGADDWLGIPFAGAELAARLRALLRRTARLCCGELSIDLAARSASRGGVALDLKPRELALLIHLARHGERIVAREELLAAVWGRHFDPGTNSIAVHISRLRDRLDRGFPTPMLHTAGSGYMLSARHGADKPPTPRDLRRRCHAATQEDVVTL